MLLSFLATRRTLHLSPAVISHNVLLSQKKSQLFVLECVTSIHVNLLTSVWKIQLLPVARLRLLWWNINTIPLFLVSHKVTLFLFTASSPHYTRLGITHGPPNASCLVRNNLLVDTCSVRDRISNLTKIFNKTCPVLPRRCDASCVVYEMYPNYYLSCILFYWFKKFYSHVMDNYI